MTASIETISGFSREFAILDRDFWQAYPAARAEDLAGLLALARRGREIPPFQPAAGAGRLRSEQDYQLGELQRSIVHCREVLGLGVRG